MQIKKKRSEKHARGTPSRALQRSTIYWEVLRRVSSRGFTGVTIEWMRGRNQIKRRSEKVAVVNPSNGPWWMADHDELVAFLNGHGWIETTIGSYDARIEPDHSSPAHPTPYEVLRHAVRERPGGAADADYEFALDEREDAWLWHVL